jgi:hypothetical protein
MVRQGPFISTRRVSDEETEAPRRVITPIYEKNPLSYAEEVIPRAQGPKLVRDRLLDFLNDEQWHSAFSMESFLPNCEWIRGMRELIRVGFTFERVSHSFKLRILKPGEKSLDMVDLLAGVDARIDEIPREMAKARPAKKRVYSFDDACLGASSEPLDSGPFEEDVLESPTSNDDSLEIASNLSDLVLSASHSVTMTAGILARKGAGKTYLGMVLAEEFISKLKPLVVLDPTGVWWGLRSKSDATPSELSVLTLGGEHGELPINSLQGGRVAELVCSLRPRPVVVDLSLLLPTEQHQFVADFGERFFTLISRSPIHLIIDEADEFAPQMLSASKHHKRCLEVIDRMVRRGRSKGIGLTLITQRPAVISKNVLSQVNSLFLMAMAAPNDLDTIEQWMKTTVNPRHKAECLNQLPNLAPGNSFFVQYSPKMFRRFKVRLRNTFDSSRTPNDRDLVTEPSLSRVAPEILEQARTALSTTTEPV